MRRAGYERCQGEALVESALVVPLLLLLFMGIIDFGRVFYAAMTITQAARAGVQYGAQDNIRSGDFAGMQAAALAAAGDVSDVTVSAGRYCRCADGSGSCDCSGGTDGCSPGSGCLAACPSDAPQVYVCVSADKLFTTLFNYPGIPSSTDLKRQAIMRVQ